MTTVPARPAIPPGRGKRANVRDYSIGEWTKGYTAWVLLLPVYLFLWALATICPRLPAWAVRKLLRAHDRYTSSHPMDFRIPPDSGTLAYMHRWWRIPRNAFFNVYYHLVLRGDDDRALHDHPWFNFSIVLEGGYFEHLIDAGGIHRKTWYEAGSVRFRRSGVIAHRLELKRLPSLNIALSQGKRWAEAHPGEAVDWRGEIELPVKTIFITGPVLRRWGFHDPERWVDAYDWDAFNTARGTDGGMRMDGGSDAVQSDRNKL